MPEANVRGGRSRTVIEGVKPEVDGGRFPIKRSVGEKVVVEADVFVDGHDTLACLVLYREVGADQWLEAPMRPLLNDRWRGEFSVSVPGRYRYTVTAWVDRFLSWREELIKRVVPEDIAVALIQGAELIEEAIDRASAEDAARLRFWTDRLRQDERVETRREAVLDDELVGLMSRYPNRSLASIYERDLEVVVDRERARFGAWYEFFPRSCTHDAREHGSLAQCQQRLPYIAQMGFDVVYLPPIHPIGKSNRKGRNNALIAQPEDPGSPWAIGAGEGGHKAVHPLLGTIEDFRQFVAVAKDLGIEVAIDVAFQTSPDHPYVKEHPEWFRHRPDGSVQYAENPPKKYEDIYPINFESEDWRSLWDELKSVFEFWIEQGITIFRVDNPHTKPFVFWEWLIGEIQRQRPDTIFLSEAFARPKVMHRLAKLGFTQSYTYFTWRNTKWELEQYLTELSKADSREYLRPSLWPNTPDILSEYLQFGGRPAFMARLVLAATMGASYGIYGPAYELFEHTPRETGSEEYLDSEKYEIRQWDLERPDSLRNYIGRVNTIRRENPALQADWNLHFHPVTNEQIICYSKATEDLGDIILSVVNLDPHHTQSGWVELPLDALGLTSEHPYQAHDLLSDARYLWNGPRNYVELDPRRSPAQIFRLRRHIRSERDFEYFF